MSIDPAWAETLWAWLSSRRWFGGKGRAGRVANVQTLGTLEASSGRVDVEVVTVSFDDGGIDYYQLITAYRPDRGDDEGFIGERPGVGFASDATFDPDAMAALLRALVDPQGASPGRVHLPDVGPLSADLPTRVYRGEQSNTNVLVGDVAIIKVFRRLEIGRNLDIEIHAALGRAGQRAVARLFGWVEGDFVDASGHAVDADLAMVVELLRDAADGFRLAVDQAGRRESFVVDAQALGAGLARVHQGLADEFGTASVNGADLAAAMRARLDQAAGEAPALGPYVPALRAIFDRLVGLTIPSQRIHGDFHLGQTLRTADGWKIIDFEGEPMKTMAERREFDSPLRDVAGMLRSFGYAAASAQPDAGPTDPGWETGARDAFLAACAPTHAVLDARVLAAYEADKAIYEVVYETRNRPDWVAIPLAAIDRLARNN